MLSVSPHDPASLRLVGYQLKLCLSVYRSASISGFVCQSTLSTLNLCASSSTNSLIINGSTEFSLYYNSIWNLRHNRCINTLMSSINCNTICQRHKNKQVTLFFIVDVLINGAKENHINRLFALHFLLQSVIICLLR